MPSHVRKDKPDFDAAFVPEDEETVALEEVITAVFMVFPLGTNVFDDTNICFRTASFQLQFVLSTITNMNKNTRIFRGGQPERSYRNCTHPGL